MITEEKKELLDSIIKFFGYYNGKALEEMSHFEEPWKDARDGLDSTENSNRVIKKDSIRDYFIKIKHKYDMEEVCDIKKYSEEQFKRVLDS